MQLTIPQIKSLLGEKDSFLKNPNEEACLKRVAEIQECLEVLKGVDLNALPEGVSKEAWGPASDDVVTQGKDNNLNNLKEFLDRNDLGDHYNLFLTHRKLIGTQDRQDEFVTFSGADICTDGETTNPEGGQHAPSRHFATNNYYFTIATFIRNAENDVRWDNIIQHTPSLVASYHNNDTTYENIQKQRNALKHKFVMKYLWMLANPQYLQVYSLRSFYNLKNKGLFQIFGAELEAGTDFDEFVENWIKLSDDIKAKLNIGDDQMLELSKLLFVNSFIQTPSEIMQNDITYIKNLLLANHQIVLTGAPGTGKTYLARQIAANMIGCEFDNPKDSPQFGFVQFHPNYDYTDFVEGLKPVKNDGNDSIGFKLEDGIFMAFCKEAGKALVGYNTPEEKKDAPKYIFVIDEINRADLSRVFGELFFAIESGYRGDKGGVVTQYASLREEKEETTVQEGSHKKNEPKKFSVPENVYIIGTMNDVDRSVESIDFALRRRFAWHEIVADDKCFDRVMEGVKSKEEVPLAPNILKSAKDRYVSLNKAIKEQEGLGTSYQIGPAYFRKLGNYTQGEDDQPKADFEKFWSYHLAPLIREYVRGMRESEDVLKKLKDDYDNPKPVA